MAFDLSILVLRCMGKGGDLRKGQTDFTVPLSRLQVLDSQNGMVCKLPSSQWARETQADHRTAWTGVLRFSRNWQRLGGTYKHPKDRKVQVLNVVGKGRGGFFEQEIDKGSVLRAVSSVRSMSWAHDTDHANDRSPLNVFITSKALSCRWSPCTLTGMAGVIIHGLWMG